MHIDPNITQCVTTIGDTIRGMIKNEDEFVNQRLTWLGQFQGLLFAAYAFLARGRDLHRVVLCIICALGVTVAFSIGVSTYAAGTATGNLVKAWDEHRVQAGDCWQPDVQGFRHAYGWFGTVMWPGHLVPPLFVLAWLVLLIHGLIHTRQPTNSRKGDYTVKHEEDLLSHSR
jgi:hypothetical protein